MARPALIIEDDPDIAESVRYNLKSAGFEPIVAATGEQGPNLALDSQDPPAVILDLMLPGMNGMELCRRLRREIQTRRTPIIMLTAKTSEADRLAGLDFGRPIISPRRFQCARVNEMRERMLIIDSEMRVIALNRAAHTLFSTIHGAN
jgi:DNA-binding response OmpR family regulator